MEIVTIWDLINEFEYTYGSARNRLYRLKKGKLVERLDKYNWILTNEGYRRLDYYGI